MRQERGTENRVSVPFVRARSAFVVQRQRRLFPTYFASGFGRIWSFTTFGRDPLPPSWCHGVYIE